MEVISPYFQNREVLDSIKGETLEIQKKSVHPAFRQATDKGGTLLELVARKKASKDRKEYTRIRQAFEQNWEKEHPFKPSL